MELKEFIEKTLCDIIDATIETQLVYTPDVKNTCPVINPYIRLKQHVGAERERSVERIHFDLSITHNERVDGKLSITIANANGSMENSNAQRVSFDIPVSLPSFDK